MKPTTKPRSKKVSTVTNVSTLLTSSGDTTQISATLQGLMLGLVPVAIQIMQARGIEVTQTQAGDIVQSFTAVLSLSVMVFGAVRKTVNLVKSVLVKK